MEEMGSLVRTDKLQPEQFLLMIVDVIVMLTIPELTVRLLLLVLMGEMGYLARMEDLQ
jgi:hypothetical protein